MKENVIFILLLVLGQKGQRSFILVAQIAVDQELGQPLIACGQGFEINFGSTRIVAGTDLIDCVIQKQIYLWLADKSNVLTILVAGSQIGHHGSIGQEMILKFFTLNRDLLRDSIIGATIQAINTRSNHIKGRDKGDDHLGFIRFGCKKIVKVQMNETTYFPVKDEFARMASQERIQSVHTRNSSTSQWWQ